MQGQRKEIFLILLLSVPLSDAFWLTDLSLFQPPFSLGQNLSVKSQADYQPAVEPSNETPANWASVGSDLKTQIRQETQVAGSTFGAACQCDLNWLRNETELMLNKWLSGAQMRSLTVSNSTGVQSKRRDGKRESNSEGWIKSMTGNKRQQHQQQQLDPPLATSAHHRQPIKLLQGERGPQGPKGEQGSRGDRGEPGLISVKDRDSLFDLAGGGKSRQLAFIEAEQMLVISTNDGWRPVQVSLSPLRDLRRAKAKFSITSEARRRQLLSERSGRKSASSDGAIIGGGSPNLLNDIMSESEQTRRNVDSAEDEDEDESEEDEGDDDDEDEEEEDEEDDETPKTSPSPSRTVKLNVQTRPTMISGGSSQIPSLSLVTEASKISKAEQVDGKLKLRLVALNEPFSGNVHGIRGADFECKRHAARSNVKGSFRAFLASNVQSLTELVRHNIHRDAIVNLRGETLANSWHDLLRLPSHSTNPLSRIYSFDGRHVASDPNWPNKLVWHGASNKFGLRDPINNCDGWHSDSLTKFGSASPLHLPRDLNLQRNLINTNTSARRQKRKRYLNDMRRSNESSLLETIDKYPCRMPLILLCIETVAQALDDTKGKYSAKSSQFDASLSSNMIVT